MIEDARLGSQHLPDMRRVFSDYDKMLFWILDVHRFKKALAAKFGLASGMSADTLRRGRKGRLMNKFGVTEIEVKDIGDELQALWQRKLTETPRLLADRSPASLRWHALSRSRVARHLRYTRSTAKTVSDACGHPGEARRSLRDGDIVGGSLFEWPNPPGVQIDDSTTQQPLPSPRVVTFLRWWACLDISGRF
jgi:hypothetical protein